MNKESSLEYRNDMDCSFTNILYAMTVILIMFILPILGNFMYCCELLET